MTLPGFLWITCDDGIVWDWVVINQHAGKDVTRLLALYIPEDGKGMGLQGVSKKRGGHAAHDTKRDGEKQDRCVRRPGHSDAFAQ
jgi:hypothetical protein